MKVIILILSLLTFINAYSQDNLLSIKGGLNYSTADYYNPSFKTETGYKLGGVLYLSWEKSIFKSLYFNIDLGMNQKGTSAQVYDYFSEENLSYDGMDMSFLSIELPFILGYKLYDKVKFYLGTYFSVVILTKLNGKMINTSRGTIGSEKGVLFGIEYIYRKYLINLRFQKAYSGHLKSTTEDTDYYYDNSSQFILMFGYNFF